MTTPAMARRAPIKLPWGAKRWLLGYRGRAWEYLIAGDLRLVWREHGEAVVAWHVKRWPGSRPRRWWTYDAPSPRRRLSGVGDTSWHAGMAVSPHYEFGLPTSWRRHGDVFASKGVPIDPADPPKFESVASFLLRLNLLLPGERERLRPADFHSQLIE
jgi:hypothetical protein